MVMMPSGATRIFIPPTKVIDVWDMGEHVVSEKQIGLSAFRGDALGSLAPEECDDTVDAESRDHFLRIVACMGEPRVGEGREVGVFTSAEDLLGLNQIIDLNQETVVTDSHVERVEPLIRVEALGGHMLLAQRRSAQIGKGVDERLIAEATLRGHYW